VATEEDLGCSVRGHAAELDETVKSGCCLLRNWRNAAFARGQKHVKGNSRTEDPLLNWTRPSREECPICMIPLPLNGAETIFWICRGKIICCGCIYDQFLVDRKDGHLTIDESSFRICPFCRNGSTTFDILDREMKLAKVGHPTALFRIGIRHFDGELLQRDTQEGIKWFRRVAEAGEAEAAFNLGVCYTGWSKTLIGLWNICRRQLS